MNIDFGIELSEKAENNPGEEGRHREGHDFTNLHIY